MLKTVRIPTGTFLMGSPPIGVDRYDSREIQHEVTINNPFEMMIYPVTQDLWQAVMGNNPSHFNGQDLPVENVSWEDSQEFIKRLNQMAITNKYRLPTEEEWEYACRAGSNNARYGKIEEIAWYDGNSGGKTHPVGRKQPNAWGLYDMLGNVWEWCESCYTGPSSFGRVMRGGSWVSDAHNCRATLQIYDTGYGNDDLGFRLVRDVD